MEFCYKFHGNMEFQVVSFGLLLSFLTLNGVESDGNYLQNFESRQTNCDCGWKKVTRIVGGEETGVNEYPMMAGLVDAVDLKIFCGATIIAKRYILTAAHCVEYRRYDRFGVVVGEHDVRTVKETNATEVLRLEGYLMHPKYNYSEEYPSNDIAICKTAKIIKFSLEVGPACLPFSHSKSTFQNEWVTALGWGSLGFGDRPSSTLQKVNLNVMSYQNCKRTYPNVNYNNMCTYANGKDSCQRDSGGPLLWYDRNNNRFAIVGIISTGIGCASEYPALSTRVGPYIGWILSVTDADFCQIE